MRRAARPLSPLAAASLLGAVLVGCGRSPPTAVQRDTIATVASLLPVSGDSQITIPQGLVPSPLVVLAQDSLDRPLAGVLVRWAGDRSSRFASDTTRTGDDGTATAVWILGASSGEYRATARTAGPAVVSFSARVDSGAVRVEVVPDTVRFASFGDTARVRFRVATHGVVSWLEIDNWSTGFWPNGMGSAARLFRIERSLMAQAITNGTSTFATRFGDNFFYLTVVVRQIAVGTSIVVLGRPWSPSDTVTLGPDDPTQLAVSAVDARGNAVADSAATTGVAWRSSNPAIVTVSETGVARGAADGVARVTADVGSLSVSAPVRVWTLEAADIVAGWTRTCSRLSSGEIACWGYREDARGSAADMSLVPELQPYGAVTSFDMGGYHGCGLRDSSAFCWGSNEGAQLGSAEVRVGDRSRAAVPVDGGLGFATVSTGDGVTCGLTTDGRAYCWGSGGGGTLGDGTYGTVPCYLDGSCASSPSAVSGGLRFAQLSTGDSHSCALTADGQAFCWGYNDYGQLGSRRVGCRGWNGGAPDARYCSTTPVAVDGVLRFRAISAGRVHTCGVTTEGQLYCWGANYQQQLGVAGLPANGGPYDAPLPVTTTLRFADVDAGVRYTCAIAVEGSAHCWGENAGGVLGTGTPRSEPVPAPVAGGLLFRSISANGHTCGITTDGVAYCWGYGGTGSNGDGTTTSRYAPAKVAYQRR